jgi:hypothetical protein
MGQVGSRAVVLNWCFEWLGGGLGAGIDETDYVFEFH